MSNNYNADSIQVLEGLEAVRKRPGMYIGNVDTRGLHHLIWEIVDNSIDEVLAGYATHIKVILNPDASVEVRDDGRGIPTGINSKTGISTVETVYTVLHAGGKFGGAESGYKVSGGLHGVGASVVNALSDYVTIDVKRDGKHHRVEFQNGGEVNSGLKEIGPSSETGTTVKFKPTFSIFNDDAREFDPELIARRLKQTAYLNKGLEIIFEDNVNEEVHTFAFPGGIIDFVEELTKDVESITGETIYNDGILENINVEVALRYTTLYQPRILSFVNNITTSEGGTHVAGFLDAVLRIVNTYAQNNLPEKGKT